MRVAIRVKSKSPGLGQFLASVSRELPARRRRLVALGAGVALSGVGHGALAFAAGSLARSLAAPHGAGDGGLDLLEACYFGLAAATVKAAGSTLLGYMQADSAGSIALALRLRLARKWSSSGLPDAAPRVIATFQVRLAELESAVVQGALAGARALAQLVPIAVGLILVSPRLAAVGTLLLGGFGLGLAALRRRFRLANDAAQARAVALFEGVDELVRHLDLWRTFGATSRVESALASVGSEAVASSARVEAARAALSGKNEILGALALLACVALAQRLGVAFADGSLVAFAVVCFMAYRPLRDLGDARAWLDRGASARAALDALVTPEPSDAPSPEPPIDWSGRRGELVLRGFGARARGPRTSTVVRAGETIAVLGANGSGKTTLLRALLGLEPGAGLSLYAGVEVSRRGVGPGARPFAWVPQEAPLVTGTILDNVALSCGDRERARRALSELGAARLLERADEQVGPGGTPLSGGERRLVALARALATELPVLLLDEPTEGLDAESRARVLDAIARLRGARSVLLVTHQADVASVASQVLSLDESTALAAE
jgi:ABC-type transport system involved in cytochrome bd biosynthesis fused ATPase/permease subunit